MMGQDEGDNNDEDNNQGDEEDDDDDGSWEDIEVEEEIGGD